MSAGVVARIGAELSSGTPVARSGEDHSGKRMDAASMSPSGDDLATTRRSLHAVAEHIMAGPQHRLTGTIRLAVTADGFSTIALGDDLAGLEVRGMSLVAQRPGAEVQVTLAGSIADVARAVGVEPGAPVGVYSDGSGADASFEVVVELAATQQILWALAIGDAALRRFTMRHRSEGSRVPVLWPEHFDVGIDLDEVNYGVSPGDVLVTEPYAYVGPWQRRRGPFWNQPFGAARSMRELGDINAVVAFFQAGRDAAVTDPVA